MCDALTNCTPEGNSVLIPLLLAVAPGLVTPSPGTLLVAGDVTLGAHYEEYVDEQVKKGQSKDELLGWGFAKVRGVTTKADVFLVNLECPFTDRGEKLPKNFNFRARPELVAALAAGGVDVVSLANNHLVDFGPEGLFDTLSTLDTAGVKHFGAGRTLAEARVPAIVDVKGVKVALLGYFFLGDRNIEPSQVIATDEQPGVAGHHSDLAVMKAMLEADIRAAKTKADHVIPFFHWGREGKVQPEPYQVELAHAAIEAGAAAVLGSHPHVLQGIEVYKGAVIAYSLGNFVFGGNWDPKDKKTALLELAVTKQAVTASRVLGAYSDAYPASPVQPYLAEGDEVLQDLALRSSGFAATLPAFKPFLAATNQPPQSKKPGPDRGPDAGFESANDAGAR
jgi:poly-gamma-glutamate synthesis protein (capsule biosynthesis protein)